MLYVDHNMGTLVKDAMVIPQPFDVIIDRYRELTTDPDTRWDDLSLADARVRIEEAITVSAMVYPRFETEEWPAARALVEWVIRRLPEGGRPYERREWSDKDRGAIAARFFAAPLGQPFDNDECREMLNNLLWFATDFAAGDPLRWSAVRVEMLLEDWAPRQIQAPAGDLMAVPALLKACIRFAHDEVGIRAESTTDVLAAVDHWEPAYQARIGSARQPGAELVAMGLERLSRDVGGVESLDELTEDPLPDEEFQWGGVPLYAVELVGEVLALIDRCCDQMFDVEMRTASRRLLAHIAARGPRVLLRKAKPREVGSGHRVGGRQGEQRLRRVVRSNRPAGEGLGRALRHEG